MVSRQIGIDEDTERLLTDLAAKYEGNLSLALTELVHVREGLGELAGKSGQEHEATLPAMRDRAEPDFRKSLTISWKNVKTLSGL